MLIDSPIEVDAPNAESENTEKGYVLFAKSFIRSNAGFKLSQRS